MDNTWHEIKINTENASTIQPILVSLADLLGETVGIAADSEYQNQIERVRRQIFRDRDSWPPQIRLRVIACVNVILDLAKQGWSFRVSNDRLETLSSKAMPDADIREYRRRQLHAQRDEQLRSPATRQFIQDMERGRLHTAGRVSIFSLMRDGRELAQALSTIDTKHRIADNLRDVVCPYIQFVEGEATCHHTGLRLIDIWRYFRHTWANPYQSTPGRSMMFIVRDAAVENHPVIGIAALSSAAIKMKARDSYIGWEPELVVQDMLSNPSDRIVKWLIHSAEALLDDIYLVDFLRDGLLTRLALDNPTDDVIAQLEAEARSCREVHQKMMVSNEYKKPPPSSPEDNESHWQDQAQTPLFRSKRAAELAAQLRIRRVFRSGLGSKTSKSNLRSLLETASGRQVTRQLLRRIKAKRVGTVIADLTVCGAIPPYNALLGGKLVAMLAASPEVTAQYRRRYKLAESVIASSMAGRGIRRPADLVFIGTTSLYGTRPCQYDRVSIPADRLGGKTGEAIRYKFIDDTAGWGTFQFGRSTSEAISHFMESQRNGVQVNYIFGEGANPRLRALRDGLKQLGFDEKVMLKHGMPKSIFGVSLIRNLKEYLLGLQKAPKYLFSRTSPVSSTRSIVEWWLDRWVARRLKRPDLLSEISRHTLIYPIEHGARVSLPDDDDGQQELFPST